MLRSSRAWCVSVVVAVLFVACGGGGSSSPTPTSPAPTAPTVNSVTVTSPGSSARTGESAQFSATAVMSNGTTQAVTGQASWQSSNTSVATVAAGGMVSAVGAGDADIRATYQNVTGSARITVTRSTFRLCGNVREDGGGGLNGARVEFTDGSNAGKNATTNGAGDYCINDALPGGFTVRASLSGFDNQNLGVGISADTTLNFTLRRNATPVPNPPGPTPPGPSPDPVNGICNAAAYPSTASCGTPSAVCNNGQLSCSQNRSGTCSQNGGVRCWLCPGRLCNGLTGVEIPEFLLAPPPAGTSLQR